ncbi:unnamed protein product [Onchocerca flexuosa]|uniref:Ovule protein n=1 Tax=Onchocerca flexuosa TaxID=387005 RepID=A0A183I7D8_9BILA|nr:unnamed protein product [Onchocerca flexuosa]
MFEQLGVVETDPIINGLSKKLCSEISNFQNKASAKGEGDISLAKARSEIRKMNKRFIARTVEVLSRTLITDMENDDIPSWWIGKCAIAVQECFVDTVGDIAEYSSSLCRQLSVNYS